MIVGALLKLQPEFVHGAKTPKTTANACFKAGKRGTDSARGLLVYCSSCNVCISLSDVMMQERCTAYVWLYATCCGNGRKSMQENAGSSPRRLCEETRTMR